MFSYFSRLDRVPLPLGDVRAVELKDQGCHLLVNEYRTSIPWYRRRGWEELVTNEEATLARMVIFSAK